MWIEHRVDADGIARIAFDQPGEPVTLFNAEALQELARVLDELRRREDVRAVLFASDKPGMFIAGMDVEEIASINDAYRAAEGARFGQAVFQQIADLERPTACAIDGPCLGGGAELALACTFRVASDDRRVRIALPEVQLGIIPGFGGCQRLPRLVGLTAALELILSGRALNGERAKKIGIVDRVVPSAFLEREATELLRQALADGTSPVLRRVRKRRPWAEMLIAKAAPVRNYILRQARTRTEKKVDAQSYPAPFRAIDAIEAAYVHPLQMGLDAEARILGQLVPTRTSKNLIWLFKNQSALKSDTARLRAAPRKVSRMAVVGAGIMGGGISQLVAQHEIPVRLKDVRYESILTALRTAQSIWDDRVRRRRITAGERDGKMAFIAPTLDDTGLVHCDLVLEAVVEKLSVKQQVLATVEQRIDDRAVFASNTSSLPIGEIAARALHPQRVVGLHFFNPVHRMPLVEVIAGRHSSPEALATVHALAVRLGKLPVIVKDSPGFLVNRILTVYLNEAMGLLAEGARIETIDPAMTAFGMPMGPFALLDQVGLDTAQHVGQVLAEAFSERIGGDGEVLDRVVDSGRLGQKNGRGFYLHRDGRRTVPDPEVYNLLAAPPAPAIPPETLQERMVLSMINEAALCLEERIVREPRDIDLAMVLGTGFPPFRGGLLRHADSIGIPIIVDRLSRLAEAQGPRFRPCDSLQRMVREQRRFYSS